MSVAFWIIYVVLCVLIVIEAFKIRGYSVNTILILVLFFILGAAQFGWPG